MGLFGLLYNFMKWIIISAIIIFSAMVCTLFAMLPMLLNPEMPSQLWTIARGVSLIFFLAALGPYVTLRKTRQLKPCGIIASLIPTGALVVSIPFFIASYFAVDLLTGSFIFVATLFLGYLGVMQIRNKHSTIEETKVKITKTLGTQKKRHVGAIEVIEIPDDFIRGSENIEPTQTINLFHSILRSCIVEHVPIGIRVETINNRTRILFLTYSNEKTELSKYLEILEGALSAYLPKFGFQKLPSFQSHIDTENLVVRTAILTGEPASIDNPNQSEQVLTAVTEALQRKGEGMIQIYAIPANSGWLTRFLTKREYQRAAEKAQKTIAVSSKGLFSSPSQESIARIDSDAARRTEQLGKKIQRVNAEYTCKIHVNLTSWAKRSETTESNLRSFALTLTGSILPADESSDIQISVLKSKDTLEDVINGVPTGASTFLTLREAAVYFTLPRCDVGIRTTRKESFSTSTEPIQETLSIHNNETHIINDYAPWAFQNKRRLIVLGAILRYGAVIDHQNPVYLHPEDLDAHLGIYGNTRTGKTTTALSIIAQLYRAGVIPIILVPLKPHEWRPLKELIPDLWIFTPSTPEISPLRINIWNPPSRVHLAKWVQRLIDAFTTCFPSDEVITMHIDKIIHTVYDNCGWSIRENIKGRPIMLQDFYDTVLEVAHGLGYGPEVKQNFTGALIARIEAFLRRHTLVEMYNTPRGITFSELLKHPTIIEVSGMSDEDRRLLASIIMSGIAEYKMANRSESVSNVIVLEEAHMFLKQRGKSLREGKSSEELAIERIVEMLRTIGGVGLGIILIDQLPGELVQEAIKIPSNIIIHKLKHPAERTLVGLQAGCSESQIEHLGGMKKGEVVLTLERDSLTKNVQIFPLSKLLSVYWPSKNWDNKLVKEMMNEVYEDHPHLTEKFELEITYKEHLPNQEDVESSGLFEKIVELLSVSAFVDDYKFYAQQALDGECKSLVAWLIEVSKASVSSDQNLIEAVEHVYSYVSKETGFPQSIEDSQLLLGRIQAEMMT